MKKIKNIKLMDLGVTVILIATAMVCFFSQKSLQKGQVIKQFFAYSITESLVKGATLEDTSLPCLPERKWSEEPPVFHLPAAYFQKMGIGGPSLMSTLAYVMIAAATFLMLLQLGFDSSWVFIGGLISVLFLPGYTRYSIQHLPDLFATALLVWGVLALLKQKTKSAYLFFLMAVTAKVLTLFAIAALLVGKEWKLQELKNEIDDDKKNDKKINQKRMFILFRSGITCILLLIPFLSWLMWTESKGIPSPFHLNNGIENRHSGSLSLLWSAGYYLRINSWLWVKGLGFLLTAGFIQRFIQKKNKLKSKESLLWFWAAGVIPYLLFVRQGNFVHDYYLLPFLFPFALLAGINWGENMNRWICENTHHAKTAIYGLLILVQLWIGIHALSSLRPVEVDSRIGRPSFCEMEKA